MDAVLSRVAHAMAYDFRLMMAAATTPRKRAPTNDVDTAQWMCLGIGMGADQVSHVGGLGLKVAQLGLAAQATYGSACDLHKAIVPSISDAPHRPRT